ncbi:MAG: hypothetical protein EBU73_09235, partial [Chitinophagia bacterium]|nr:hypothetical protein [Chitinophagia bacterium]
MATRMQQRRGTAQQWLDADPILAAGEIGFETDTGQFKIGDGVNHWEDLSYFKNLEDLGGNLDDYILLTEKAAANGVATLDGTGNIPMSQLGNIIDGAPALLNTLNEIANAIDDDSTFANTVVASLSTKAPTASPNLTGTPTAPTPSSNNDSNQIATTAFVKAQGYALASTVDTNKTDAENAISLLDGRLDTAESDINTLQSDLVAVQGDVTTLQGSTTSLDGRLDTAESNITTLQGDLSTAETNITTIQGDITTAQSDINAAESRLDTAESEIDGLQGSLTTAEGEIDQLQSDVTSLQTDVTALQGTIDTPTTGLTARLTAAESDIGSLQTTVDTPTTGLSDRMTAAEGDINTLQGDLDTAESTLATAVSDLDTHEAATTSVHGIANTANLATKAYADSAATNAQTAAQSYADTGLALKANLAGPTFTGTVTLPSTTSIGTVSATELGYVDGVTSAIQTQIDAKAPLASPALTGVPTAPTAAAGTNTTQIATTAFVGTAVADLVASAPATLNTLNELATAL